MVESLANHSVGIILQHTYTCIRSLHGVPYTWYNVTRQLHVNNTGVKTHGYLLCKNGSLMPLIARQEELDTMKCPSPKGSPWIYFLFLLQEDIVWIFNTHSITVIAWEYGFR